MDDRARETLRPGASGVPVVLADGGTYLLAYGGLDPAVRESRDRLFDASQMGDQYDEREIGMIFGAAHLLLVGCHDLADVDAFGLLQGADLEAVVRATEKAVLGRSDDPIGYTDWLELSLLINGIDPRIVPPAKVVLLVDALDARDLALPRAIIGSVRVAQRQQMRASLMRPAAPPVNAAAPAG